MINSIILSPYDISLGFSDYFFGLVALSIIIAIASSKKQKMLAIEGNEHYKYYLYNVYFKLGLATVFGAIYMFYYGGGDTIAYWLGADKLNNLFWFSPSDYLTEMLSTPSRETIILRFNSTTGHPPGWIYADPNSFFISKILSVMMFVFGKSYMTLTFVLAYITAMSSWKIFELIRYYKISSEWMMALAALFIPSVSFWCAGVSKDTVIFVSVCYLVHYLFGFMNKTLTNKIVGVLFILFYFFVLNHTRGFMTFTIAGPILFALSTRYLKKYKDKPFILNSLRILIAAVGIIALAIFLQVQGEAIAKLSTQYLEEAAVTQGDFTNNKIYTGAKYNMEITDFSPVGLLKVAPQAIIIAIYRPVIWEATSALLIISGLETSLFIYLTYLFLFKGKIREKITVIRFNEFLVFCFFFAIILAFFVGFTSILFGVLVRFKAPLLPFFLLILISKGKGQITDS